jgi:hypothetical protein
MDILTGKFDHIEDILCRLHGGQWFGWSDSKNKIYGNLVIRNSDYDKPSEKSLTDALAKHRGDFDTQEYARNRQSEYPSNGDQWDMMYKDNLNSTTTHKDAVEAVKTKWPKDNSGPIE